MDYRKAYLDVYNPILEQQEKKVVRYLRELKNQKRKWQSANSKVASILFQDLKDFERIASFHIHYQIPDYINNKNDFYSEEDSLNLILQNEVQDLFDDGTNLNIETYEEFIKVLATYQGLENARSNYANLRWLVELYYEYDEIEKLKLDYFGNVRDHPDYLRLTKRKVPNLKEINLGEQFNIAIPQEEKNKEVDNLSDIHKEADYEKDINKIKPEEKIFMLHYLINMTTKRRRELDETEAIKVLYITDGVFDASIFTKESKNITFVNKYRKGLFYYDNPLKRKNVKESILKKTIGLKIDKFREFFDEDN